MLRLNLLRRLVVLTCLVLALPAVASAQLRTEVVAEGFQRPVAVVPDPLAANTLIVLEQTGRAIVVVDGVRQPTPFLDLTDEVEDYNEQGLLSLVFDPTDPQRVFVFFVKRRNPDLDIGDSVIARFRRRQDDPRQLDLATRFDFRWWDGNRYMTQPTGVHKGGQMHFGPDGYLYVGLGDGGGGGDPVVNAQNPWLPYGKMLRLNVTVPDSHPTGFVAPPDNPFIDGQPVAALPEIWSFGWRNPWRWSFDDFGPGATGAIIAGDVGQGDREEVNYEPAGRGGRNYGWYIREGTIASPGVSPFRQPAYLPLQEPLVDYPRSIGRSVTGGYVYRGSALPAFYRGRYFVADFFGGVYSLGLAIDGNGDARVVDVVDHSAEFGNPMLISSFGRDPNGELFLVTMAFGGNPARVVRIVPDTSNPPGTPLGLASQVNGSTVTLNWQRNPDGGPVLAYRLEAGSSEGASDIMTANVSATGIVVPAVPSGLYWVRVRGENAGGTSVPTQDIAVRVGCGGPPLLPSNLSATVGENRVVTLQWTRAADALNYAVVAGSAPGLANLAQLAVSGTQLSVQAPPGVYYVRVHSLTACGPSQPSNEIVVTVP